MEPAAPVPQVLDPQRAARTASIARKLIDKLGPQDEAVKHHLLRACMLHEVGQAVSHTGAHKHAAYIVEHADLPGFTAREQHLMSTIVLGQKGNLRKVREALAVPDLAKNRATQEAILAATIDAWRPAGAAAGAHLTGAIDPADWDASVAYMTSLGLVPKPVTANDLVDTSFTTGS